MLYIWNEFNFSEEKNLMENLFSRDFFYFFFIVPSFLFSSSLGERGGERGVGSRRRVAYIWRESEVNGAFSVRTG